jgi:hypothetical protein
LVADPLQREPSSANLSIAAQAARQAEAGPPPPKQKQQTRYDDEDDEGAGHTAKSERELNNLVGAVDDDDVNIDLDADELDSDDDDDWSADSMSDDDTRRRCRGHRREARDYDGHLRPHPDAHRAASVPSPQLPLRGLQRRTDPPR